MTAVVTCHCGPPCIRGKSWRHSGLRRVRSLAGCSWQDGGRAPLEWEWGRLQQGAKGGEEREHEGGKRMNKTTPAP